jgi:hypothetical protein
MASHAVSCRALGSPGRGFASTRTAGCAAGALAAERLKTEVAHLLALHEDKYGSPRITADLRGGGVAGQRERRGRADARAVPGGQAEEEAQGDHRPGKARWWAPDLVKRGRLGIRQSMGRPGSALNNAVIESWHSTLEFELRSLEHFSPGQQHGPGSPHGSRSTFSPGHSKPIHSVHAFRGTAG